jgi:Domain of unknown function (DUF1707)
MSDFLPARPDPLPADLLRVGDAERQQAVSALGDHYAAGRLDQDEYDTRIQSAYAARTRVDLRGLFGDLPAPAPFAPSPGPGWQAGRVARDRPAGRRGPGSVPVFPILLVLAIVASAALRLPIFPIVLVLWFGFRHRAWP